MASNANNRSLSSLPKDELFKLLMAHFSTTEGRREAAKLLGSELAADTFALARRQSDSSYETSADDKLIIAQVIRRIH